MRERCGNPARAKIVEALRQHPAIGARAAPRYI